MASTQHLRTTQDSPSSLLLLRAVRVAHQNNQWSQSLSFLVSVVLAFAGLMVHPQSAAAATVAVVGAVWAVLYRLLLAPWAERHLWSAAVLQERFDTEVLGLPWNRVAAGDPIGDEEVSRLARRFRGDPGRLTGYYLVADAMSPYGVLFCLEQNLAWGSRVRLRFAKTVAAFAVIWTVFGLLLMLSTGGTVNRLLSGWFVPSLGLLLICLDVYRVQVASSRERTRVLGLVRAAREDPASPLIANTTAFMAFARQVQDTLFAMRRVQPRLPQWFFEHFHDRDKDDFKATQNTLEARFPPASSLAP